MLRENGSISALDPSAAPAPVVSSSSVLLSEAVRIYLHQKGKGRPVTFHGAAERSCGYVIDACSDKHLDTYTKADANAFRDALIARGLNGSRITRVFGTVRAVTNFAVSEQGLSLTNPFAEGHYDRTAGVSDRNPVPADALAAVQAQCRSLDDDMRWLVALVSDTAMRLAEAAGAARGALATAAWSPDAGERALLADPCFILEPHLQGFAPGVIRQGLGCGRGDVS